MSVEKMVWKIPLFKTYSDENDVQAVAEVIRRGTYWATGPEINELEQELASFLEVKYVLCFNSGTSALLAMLEGYDLKGSEVIVPTFTFVATSNAVILAGAKPVFAESEGETFGLDADDVEKRITPKTRAVIQLHYGGCAGRDTERLRKICKERDIIFLDDAAESLGAKINSQKLGTLSDAAMFSFCQNKIITCGEGGMVATDDQKLYEKMKLFRAHGRIECEGSDYFSSVGDFDYLQVGHNFRISTISAALALSQLKKIEWLIKLRQKNANYLNRKLSGIIGLKLPIPPKGFNHLYQMYTLRMENENVRNKLQDFLSQRGIQTKVYFNPVHLKTYYRKSYGHQDGDFPYTEDLSRKVLTLPMSPLLKEDDLRYITDSIKEFFIMNR
jgi:perosamine synthetase